MTLTFEFQMTIKTPNIARLVLIFAGPYPKIRQILALVCSKINKNRNWVAISIGT